MSDKIKNRFVLTGDRKPTQHAVVKVVGVGGGGSNAVDHMLDKHIEGVEFYAANTDAQALERSQVANKIQFGEALTKGLGAGANPQIGRDAALENPQAVAKQLADADMVFITAGMGGGTGTGAAPMFSQILKQANPDILVVAVVTTPFEFEGQKRMGIATSGLECLDTTVDSLITIPNEKILDGEDLAIKDAYAKVNDVLRNAVQVIAGVVVHSGYINVDFADVKTIMSVSGATMMGSGSASGADRATLATRAAFENPLVADVNVNEAKGILINITGSSSVTTKEFSAIGSVVKEIASENANIITGHVFDESLEEEIRVTIVATGLQQEPDSEKPQNRQESDVEQNGFETGHRQHHPENHALTYDYMDSNAEESNGNGYDTNELPAVFRNSNGRYKPTEQDRDNLLTDYAE